ncbi:PSD1 and planctomycete cytochrome C domain-containing protein [Armatimonas sp.]|uniref:PSD1 and planctomycete cytochrome C domain-containing protein n=1 Tax=Armatimonas sp. TaxID=1872638 RepID=UPI00286AFA3E|nr:PSD1 and planctomycete cytochrome C domain-containing protein [Armatimonas sp.]
MISLSHGKLAVFALASLMSFAALAAPQKTEPVRFNRDIRPILSDNCFACHGPDKNKRQAGLRLDQPNRAVISGDILASVLVKRVQDGTMPPAAFHKILTSAQKQLLMRWIGEGAKYEGHWSFQPISPRVGTGIDAIITARLAKEKLTRAPLADKATLIRRVSLDVTGLPPRPERVAAFVSDTRPDAYAKLVDELLASPHYGERMAVPWLDAVRYADTVGYHGDQNMNAWAYRDWVVDAFNANMPFDRFTREQLAGDLLPSPTPSQLTATCFNRLNMVTREGGAQPKEYLHKYATDRVRTVGMAWMGLTTGCAECHDHKFDPLTQRDFYALAAYFADVKQWGVYADYGYTPNPDLRGVNNDYPFFPEISVESRYLKQRIAQLQGQIETLAAPLSVSQSWLGEQNAYVQANPDGWEADEKVVLTGNKATDEVRSLALKNRSFASVRLELYPVEGSLFRKGVRSETVNLSVAIVGKDGKTRNIPLRHAAASAFEPIYRNSFALLGVHRGWKLADSQAQVAQTAVYRFEKPITLGEGESLRVTLPGCDLACFRLSTSPLVPRDPDDLTLPGKALTPRDYLLATAADASAFAKAKALESEIIGYRGGRTPVMVTERAKTPLTMRVVPRGNWQDETAPVVTAATPSFLPKPTGGSRLELANWLIDKSNPLTSRVFINRLWKHFFGVGLSPSIEDLGAQGEPPTYPELLDMLAADFQRDWNVKRAVKQLVLSEAYRRSSVMSAAQKSKDPQNKLWASQNPRRLEAEFVRDNALAIAGLLNPSVGGPPAMPYQPEGYYAPLQFPDRNYVADKNDSQWRRGVYMHWQRTFLHPMLASFDAPNRDEPSCTRTNANTPQQALTLLNDPEFVEAARVFAGSLRTKTDDAKLTEIYQRALARAPKPQEQKSLLAFLAKVRTEYAARPEDAQKFLATGNAPLPEGDAVELASWASVCRVVLNLHETITRY